MSPKAPIVAGLVVLLGAAAFTFGSVEAWAEEGLRLGALAVFAATFWRRPADLLRRSPARALALPGALLTLWAIVQVVPLPGAVLSAIAPRTARLYAQASPSPHRGEAIPAWLLARAPAEGASPDPRARAWTGPADRGDPVAGRTLSIDPHRTRRALLQWVTMLLLLVTAAELARAPEGRYRLLWGVSGLAGCLGLLAVAQSVTWNERVLWFRRLPQDAEPLGPFVNRNHFAGFVEMAVLVAIGLLLAFLARPHGRLSYAGFRAALRDRDWTLPRVLAVGLLCVLGVSGLVLAGSRGGGLAFAFGLLVLGLAGAGRSRAWLPLGVLALALAGLGAGLAAWVAGDRASLRDAPFVSSSTDPSARLRADAYAKTLRIFLDNPVGGTGLGTFGQAYAGYQRQGEWMSMAQAHNDYLQLVSETGAVGLALLAWALVAFGWRLLRPALGSGGNRPRWTTAAVVAAVLAMLMHSVLDFNLQVPAVAALFAVLLGVLAAAAEDRAEESQATAAVQEAA